MENAESLMIEQLKRFQTGQNRIERKLEQVTRRLANLEAGQASLIQTSGTLHRWRNSNKSMSMSSGSGVSTLKYVLNCMLELQCAESKKAHICGPLTFS